MANKTFSGLTATTTLADADLFAVEKSGNSRKVTAANVRSALAPTRHIRIFASTSSATTIAVDNTSYVRSFVPFSFTLDYDYFPFTYYRISLAGSATQGATTITLELRDMGIGAAVSAGNDLVVSSAAALYSSSWITRTATLTGGGIRELAFYMKGSNGTVDLSCTFCDVELRV